MHRELRELLHSAEGESRRVVVVFLDVRGFSSFAGIAESTDTAEFLKTVYIRILDEFFPDAEFFKPTGDGLLILLGYTSQNLEKAIRFAVDKSIEIVEGFPALCANDPMINFDVPTKLGVGLARGSATSLTANGKVLDYSGRPLNLASRLMDLARPSGIVFDDRFGYDLLTEAIKKRFKEDSAYVKGLAESKPMKVYRLDGFTEIPEYAKHPLDGFIRFTEAPEVLTFKTLAERDVFRHNLSKQPARTDNIEAHVRYPKVRSNGQKQPGVSRVNTLPAQFGTAVGNSFAEVDYREIAANLKKWGVKSTWNVEIILEYSVIPEETKKTAVSVQR